MSFSCPKCGHQETNTFEVCPKCEIIVRKFLNPTFPDATARKKNSESFREESTKENKLALIAIAITITIGFLALVFGNVHFISGSTYDGRPVVSKMSFGFSETFINTDRIVGRPWVTVQAQHPLAVKVLQREGWLESDGERERRAQRELQRETQREMDRIQREAERLMRDIWR